MSTHQLAIIIPAYKSTFLRETLESIANQSDKRFHLYIGDDCSPYDLESIVDEYRDRIPLTYHRFETNLGGRDLVGQWERCIALSNNEPYIWLFSDDDTMSTNCCSIINSHIANHQNSSIFRLTTNVIDYNSSHLRTVKFPSKISAKELYIGKLNGNLECFVVEYIFSRKIYDATNGFVKFDLAWGSDLATWVNMSINEYIETLTNCYINWRSSGLNISTTQSIDILRRKADALIEFLYWSEQRFNFDHDIKIANCKGLLSRLTQMAQFTNLLSFGYEPIRKYAHSSKEQLVLLMIYRLLFFLKKIKNVF